MGSSQMKLRFVFFAMTLLVFVHLSHCFSLSKIDDGRGSLETEKSVGSPNMGSVLLRQRRMSHLSICVYCCGCCNRKGSKKTCGYCCKL
ncbi:hepcidin-2-like [Scyliorhinus canicula]|uniref:hepcidin-2-like n=1 Tax=Scyliorhinus canicula TaxID=7830 RepID=UPI0018F74819|nr:hepcidin-2-like [Scyliorhinus canicula]